MAALKIFVSWNIIQEQLYLTNVSHRILPNDRFLNVSRTVSLFAILKKYKRFLGSYLLLSVYWRKNKLALTRANQNQTALTCDLQWDWKSGSTWKTAAHRKNSFQRYGFVNYKIIPTRCSLGMGNSSNIYTKLRHITEDKNCMYWRQHRQ